MQKKTSRLQSWFGVQDMTVGRPMDSLVRFSIPLLVGNLAQQLYNTVDSIVVGQYIGDTALAAVGTAGPILNLLLVLFMGIATGASILSAQYFGAHDRQPLPERDHNRHTQTENRHQQAVSEFLFRIDILGARHNFLFPLRLKFQNIIHRAFANFPERMLPAAVHVQICAIIYMKCRGRGVVS